MAIIVEDGSIIANANSYISIADTRTYALARGTTLSAVDADVEELIIKAMDYVESLGFKGIKFTQDQALQFPRANVYVDGYLISTDEIPSDLIKGLNEVILSINNGEDPLADIARVQSSVKVGSLEVEYAPGSSTTLVRKISAALRKLLTSAGGSSFNVKR